MSSRVYLHCTSFQALPESDEWDTFFAQSGVEYEAGACIPLFWLMLFSADDIRFATFDDDGIDGEEEARSYAYLICDRASGVARLHARAPLMRASLGGPQFSLYEAWCTRMADEPYENVLVRTEELDCMGEEGELESQLREALQQLEQVAAEGALRMDKALRNITGLWSEDMRAYDAFELVGTANTSPTWPVPFAPPPLPSAPVVPQTKPWWAFWR
ncbi:hypothetical protein [Luteimonas sp. 3794]|uniref:hypothetical protein n=1 Tax=Luteimonas sp. 3794 TaxID=2817730 RepID=UPI002865AEDE|nr:hypothetical protein [Luteimonas sp. 3794]MDR6992721.1 hypothetical protein [Luteimonas sp. 3794]